MGPDFQYLGQQQTVCGRVYIYAKVNGHYGWYTLEPAEMPITNTIIWGEVETT